MKRFLQALDTQRWDDHRYYHQSRINQSLHFISAISFLVAYAYVFIDPAISGLIGWCISMVTRQSGHFFFEPKGYDHVNQATHEHKEAIKVGYNLNRKLVLIAVWAAVPVLLAVHMFDTTGPGTTPVQYVHDVGLAWFALGVAGLLFRMLQLFVVRDVQTGLVWVCKILTDPFHDVKLYWRAPWYVLQGQMIDPAPNKR